MKEIMPKKLLVAMVLLGLLFGCASYPISSGLREVARSDISFPMVLSDPSVYAGAIVIWGGLIIETTKVPDGSEIVVLETPLKDAEVPRQASYSQGRFIAKSSQFLDPAIYKVGKKVTIAGEIVGSETRPLDKSEYSYPVIKAKEIYLWQPERIYAYEPYYYPYYWPGWWPEEYYGVAGFRQGHERFEGGHERFEERHEGRR